MLKKPITFEDLDGNSVTETFYFYMSKPEWMGFDASFGQGGIAGQFQQAVENNDVHAMYNFLERLVQRAYGVRSDDGRRFIKGADVSLEFTQMMAYEVLMDELTTDDKAASDFLLAIVPADMKGPTQEAMNKQIPTAASPFPPRQEPEPRKDGPVPPPLPDNLPEPGPNDLV